MSEFSPSEIEEMIHTMQEATPRSLRNFPQIALYEKTYTALLELLLRGQRITQSDVHQIALLELGMLVNAQYKLWSVDLITEVASVVEYGQHFRFRGQFSLNHESPWNIYLENRAITSVRPDKNFLESAHIDTEITPAFIISNYLVPLGEQDLLVPRVLARMECDLNQTNGWVMEVSSWWINEFYQRKTPSALSEIIYLSMGAGDVNNYKFRLKIDDPQQKSPRLTQENFTYFTRRMATFLDNVSVDFRRRN